MAPRLSLLLCTVIPGLSVATPSSSARRLVIRGSKVSEPEDPDTPISLRGFSWMYQDRTGMRQVSAEDRAVSKLLPGTNLARLVMDHWLDDGTTRSGTDCYAGDRPSHGYLSQKCIAQFDDIVQWAAGDAGMWSIITARAALAAGDGGPGSTVFTNNTLRSQMIAMWGFLARRYKGTDNIAGYEVMSEPRTTADKSVVHAFHKDACGAVWAEDPDAACIIGPAKFYNRGMYSDDYILKGKVIYAANFFEPKEWVNGNNKNIRYGGQAKCGDVTTADLYCPQGKDEMITLNKAWLRQQLDGVSEFSKKHQVPMWIDQWGVHGDAGGGETAQEQYLTDVLDVFDSNDFHWAYWIWRRTSGTWSGSGCPGGYAAYCQFNNGTYHLNEMLVDKLRKYIGGQPSSFLV